MSARRFLTRFWRPGLSGKLMILTLFFVMLAEVLIFVPSVANFRNNWFRDRLAAAQTAALVLEAAPAGMVPDGLASQLLDNVGAVSIAMKTGGARRLLAVGEQPQSVAHSIDLRESAPYANIRDTLYLLLMGGDDHVLVTGAAPMGGEFIEMVVKERPLHTALLQYGRNILLLSLAISGITAALVYATLHYLIVRPVKRLADSATAFGRDAENVRMFLQPTQRSDEIGEAEQRLSEMQVALSQQLRQQQHLASLGLAVAKINHDLRNMLSSAHLLSDRLSMVRDPTVQRLAPKLISALDRAVGFCQATLAYGRAQERAPSPRKFDLWQLAEDLGDLLAIRDRDGVDFRLEMAKPMLMTADPDQLLRVLMNLCRNSLEAMQPDAAATQMLLIEARRRGESIEIDVTDSGPGIPPEVRANLFKAFSGSARPGGTGLGLVIAADLVRAHGGQLALVEAERGARFRITLPA